MLYRKIDSNGLFIEDVILQNGEEVTSDLITIPCPDGFYRPKWNGTQWIEGLAQIEIDALKNVVTEPTLEERVSFTETKVVSIEETIDVLFGGI